jgi:hypothetical protein
MKRVGFKKKTYAEAVHEAHLKVAFMKPKQWKQRSTKRARQERLYNGLIQDFLAAHPICPVTGEQTTQIHHSAKRHGEWLNLQRYWIATSITGHMWIEDNKKEAEKYGLMVRITETYKEHIATLLICEQYTPIFYERHRKLPLVNENNEPIHS